MRQCKQLRRVTGVNDSEGKVKLELQLFYQRSGVNLAACLQFAVQTKSLTSIQTATIRYFPGDAPPSPTSGAGEKGPFSRCQPGNLSRRVTRYGECGSRTAVWRMGSGSSPPLVSPPLPPGCLIHQSRGPCKAPAEARRMNVLAPPRLSWQKEAEEHRPGCCILNLRKVRC